MGAWGHGLFQSDHDLDMIDDFSHEAGLDKLEDAAKSDAKATGKKEKEVDNIHYTIYGNTCSDIEPIRKHLDAGILTKMIKEKEAKLLSEPDPQQFDFYDPCYAVVLLGACAMTLGCQLPDSYVVLLKKVYTEGGLMPGALKQMKKALFGPNGYKNGEPYDFDSKGLYETMISTNTENRKPNSFGAFGMNVPGPGGFFNTGMGDSTTSSVIKELREKHGRTDACGGCGAYHGHEGKALLICSRCKDRKYCSYACQKKHWKVHKKVCESSKVVS